MASVLVAIIIAGVAIYLDSHFRMTGSTPGIGGTIATSTGTIKLDFNRPLDASRDYTKNMTGDTIVINDIVAEGESLFVRLDLLVEGTDYSFTIKDIYSTEGELIEEVQVSFSPKHIPFNQLSKAQQDLELAETDRGNTLDPILEILPHSTLEYDLTAINTTNHDGEYELIIERKIRLTQADINIDRKEAIKNYTAKANDYLKQNGFKLEDYDIRTVIIEP